MSLGKKVFTSAFLLFVRKIWGNVINLVVMAFLARMLSKEDFGLLAISSVLLSIINTLATSGIAEYVVFYKGEGEREHVSAAFWLNLLLTLGVVFIVLLVGPAWSSFYGSEAITTLLFVLLVSFFFEMLSTIPKALLRKELNYQVLVYYSSVSMTVVSIGKLAAAWWGLGVYSLAVPQAFVSPLLCASFFLKTGWRPMTQLGTRYFGVIVTYTRSVIGGRVLTRLVNEGDNLIIGKFVGLEGLGIYALAFQLANLVTTNVVLVANELVLPVFSRINDNLYKLRFIYLRMIVFLSLICFPLIVALVLTAKSIVGLVYGEQWLEAVLPFQILCLFALSRSLNSPSSSLLNSIGRPEINLSFAAVFTPIFLLVTYFGSQFDVTGVALATSITRFLGSFALIAISSRLIGSNLSEVIFQMKNILISSLLTLLCFSFLLIDFEFKFIDIIRIGMAPLIIYLNLMLYRFLFYTDLVDHMRYLETQLGNSWPIKSIRRILFLNYVQ